MHRSQVSSHSRNGNRNQPAPMATSVTAIAIHTPESEMAAAARLDRR